MHFIPLEISPYTHYSRARADALPQLASFVQIGVQEQYQDGSAAYYPRSDIRGLHRLWDVVRSSSSMTWTTTNSTHLSKSAIIISVFDKHSYLPDMYAATSKLGYFHQRVKLTAFCYSWYSCISSVWDSASTFCQHSTPFRNVFMLSLRTSYEYGVSGAALLQTSLVPLPLKLVRVRVRLMDHLTRRRDFAFRNHILYW